MVLSDPIGDMLARIRNANVANHEVVDVPASRIKRELARIFKEEGFIREYEIMDEGKNGIIRLYLRYGPNRQKVIIGLKRISKPGLRVYAKKDELPKVLGGLGIAVLSTPRGVMTEKRARREGVGGEVICYVW